MDLDLTSEDRAFRDEVRGFLDESLTPELRAAGRRVTSAFCEPRHTLPWQRILHAKGWAAPSWPREYGGQGRGAIEQLIFLEEAGRAEGAQRCGRRDKFPLSLRLSSVRPLART
jgi:acyl-CoA dehydrogenase